MGSLSGDLTTEAMSRIDPLESSFSGNGTGEESGWKSTVSLNYPLGTMIVVAILLFVVIVGTATGNLFVVIALVRYRNLRTVSNYLIGNLAVSDFLLATTIFPLSTVNECLGYWVFGRAACQIWLTLDVLYCTASIWNLCVIAFDRFTATMYPVWYRGRQSAGRQAAVYAVVVWCVAAVICVPPLLGWKDAANGNYKYDAVNDVHACMLFQTRGYVIYSASGSFYVPLVVTLFFYTSIFVIIHSRMRKTRAARASQSATSTITAAATASSEPKFVDTGKSGLEKSFTVVDVEMSSMAAPSVELCPDGAVRTDRTKIDTEPVPPNPDTSDAAAADRKDKGAEKNWLQVPTIVVQADAGPTQTLVADIDENGCPGRFGTLSAQPDPDSISIRSCSMNRRLSFVAIKNALSSLLQNALSSRLQTPDNPAARRQRAFEQRQMRATVRMAIIIAFFCGFWLGFFVVYVVHGCCPDCYVPRELDAFFFWLGYSNSSVNPILYTIFNEEFRRAFLRMLSCKLAGARK